MKFEQTECSESLAYKIQTPGITQKEPYNKIFKITALCPNWIHVDTRGEGKGRIVVNCHCQRTTNAVSFTLNLLQVC